MAKLIGRLFEWIFSLDGENWKFNVGQVVFHSTLDSIIDMVTNDGISFKDVPWVTFLTWVKVVLYDAFYFRIAKMMGIKRFKDDKMTWNCPFSEIKKRLPIDLFHDIGDIKKDRKIQKKHRQLIHPRHRVKFIM
jgi:hypothetical protein